jgi:biopolymer transport protein ExbD
MRSGSEELGIVRNLLHESSGAHDFLRRALVAGFQVEEENFLTGMTMKGQNCRFMFHVIPSGGADKIWSLTFLSNKARATSIILVNEGVIVGGKSVSSKRIMVCFAVLFGFAVIVFIMSDTRISWMLMHPRTAWLIMHPNEKQVILVKADNSIIMLGVSSPDAIVVTVTRAGEVFLGQNKTSVTELGAQVRYQMGDKPGKRTYIYADAYAQYRVVENAIDAMRMVGVDDVVFMTIKRDDELRENHYTHNKPAAMTMGLEIEVPQPPLAERPPSHTILVQVLYRSGEVPGYKINGVSIPKAELQGKLLSIYANRALRVIFVEADDNIDFGKVAEVIDIAKYANVDHIELLTPKVMAGGPSLGVLSQPQ